MIAQMQMDQEDINILTENIVKSLSQQLAFIFVEKENSLMTVDDLAGYLQVSADWVYKQVKDRTVPVCRVGKNVRFQKKEVDRWLEERLTYPVAINPASRKLMERKT